MSRINYARAVVAVAASALLLGLGAAAAAAAPLSALPIGDSGSSGSGSGFLSSQSGGDANTSAPIQLDHGVQHATVLGQR